MTWKNVPIPETVVIPLAAGIISDYFFSRPLFSSNIFWQVLALMLLIFGLTFMIWSVREAGKLDMVSPDRLITSGPYSFSRNPMYVSWISIYLSVFFISRSLWLLLLLVVAILITHFLVIIREERTLSLKFGDQFEEYCEKVRRYI
jgi:protein-S-isoprenylcysteine O-methyltransferase Ste14